MKLRIKENSIRLRLRQPEVACAASQGRLESTTDFGPTALRFTLVGKDVSGMSARFTDNTIVVTAPQTALAAWAKSDDVGLYGEQATSTGDMLTIAIEKDFRCLDRSHADDDQAGTYPHPALKSR
jgi:hypothetical protein